MKEKLYEIYKRYKIAIFVTLIIILVGTICLTLWNSLTSNSKIVTLDGKNYNLKYDNSWNLKERKDGYLILKHKRSKSTLKIEIVDLDKEYKYTDIGDLIDEIVYNIGKQNKNYKLISKQEDVFTKYEFNGYKLLYETDSDQVMIMTFKKSDKLIIASYEAKNKYFDMLLDSVDNIIYNFNTKDETFNISNNIKSETSEINYSKSEKLDKLLVDNKVYEIAYNNYKVTYEIPKVFELYEFDTTSNYFNLRNIEDGSMTMSVNIYNKNIYEYLDKDNSSNVYKNYKIYKEDKTISDFEEQISKLNSNYFDGYIYKNSYKSKATKYNDNFEAIEYNKTNENVELIYSLNQNHILIINIKSSGSFITKKLVDSIKIKSASNYSSYTKNKVDNNNRIAELQKYVGYEKNKINNIVITLPKEYKEIDKNHNLYDERYFGLDYDVDNEIYDYIVHYRISNIEDISKNIESLNLMFRKSYGEYNYYKKNKTIMVNGKSFIEYVGGYTDLGGIPFTNINRYKYYVNHKALFYKLNDGGYLIIEIKGNGKEISDKLIKQVTNFEIKEKDIK